MDIQIKTDCFDDAAQVRRAVFMDEQGYENEFDAIDEAPSCIHVTLYVDGALAGCSRVFPEELEREADAEAPVSPACELDEGVTAGETYIMGRVAVLPTMRRRGLASKIIEASDAAASDAGAKLIKLHAQEYVLPLYAKAGYTQIAPVDYEDEGQPHAWMAKLLGDRWGRSFSAGSWGHSWHLAYGDIAAYSFSIPYVYMRANGL